LEYYDIFDGLSSYHFFLIIIAVICFINFFIFNGLKPIFHMVFILSDVVIYGVFSD